MEMISTLNGTRIDMCDMENKIITKKYIIIDNWMYSTFVYNKDTLCYNDVESRLYKLVIYSYPEKELVCYSPPKTMITTEFMAHYPEITSNIVIQEYIDGVMLHLFYDKRCDVWRIVSGEDTHNIIEQFKSIFHMNETNHSPVLDYLNTSNCYTFIFNANAENDRKFYLVSVYELINNIVRYIPVSEYENDSFLRDIEGIIYFPKQYDVSCYNDLLFYENNIGYVLTDTNNGIHTKMICPNYSTQKALSTIDSYYIYEYLCVRRIDKLYEYNQIHRNTKSLRYQIHNEYERVITQLHNYYANKYIHKRKISIPEKYIRYLALFHKRIYISSLKKKNKMNVTRSRIKEYLNRMDPIEILYLLIAV
jgi:hypothetical protein